MRAIQKNSDGRYFVVVDYSEEGKYPRVNLRTRQRQQVLWRLQVLEDVADTEESKRRIRFIDDATTEGDEKERFD